MSKIAKRNNENLYDDKNNQLAIADNQNIITRAKTSWKFYSCAEHS